MRQRADMYRRIDRLRHAVAGFLQFRVAGLHHIDDRADELTTRVFEAFWNRSLHDGFIADTALPEKAVALRADWDRPARPAGSSAGLTS